MGPTETQNILKRAREEQEEAPQNLSCVNLAAAVPSLTSVFVGFVCFHLIPEPEPSAVGLSGLDSESDPRNEAATRRRLKVHKSTQIHKHHEEFIR